MNHRMRLKRLLYDSGCGSAISQFVNCARLDHIDVWLKCTTASFCVGRWRKIPNAVGATMLVNLHMSPFPALVNCWCRSSLICGMWDVGCGMWDVGCGKKWTETKGASNEACSAPLFDLPRLYRSCKCVLRPYRRVRLGWKGLVSARALCPLLEYVPLILK
jgi:hypothetical protein